MWSFELRCKLLIVDFSPDTFLCFYLRHVLHVCCRHCSFALVFPLTVNPDQLTAGDQTPVLKEAWRDVGSQLNLCKSTTVTPPSPSLPSPTLNMLAFPWKSCSNFKHSARKTDSKQAVVQIIRWLRDGSDWKDRPSLCLSRGSLSQ